MRRLMLDISGVTFTVARSPEPKTDFASKRQRTERDTNAPLWVVHLIAMDSQDTEIIKVTVAGEEPKLTQGQFGAPGGPGSDPVGAGLPPRRRLPRRADHAVAQHKAASA